MTAVMQHVVTFALHEHQLPLSMVTAAVAANKNGCAPMHQVTVDRTAVAPGATSGYCTPAGSENVLRAGSSWRDARVTCTSSDYWPGLPIRATCCDQCNESELRQQNEHQSTQLISSVVVSATPAVRSCDLAKSSRRVRPARATTDKSCGSNVSRQLTHDTNNNYNNTFNCDNISSGGSSSGSSSSNNYSNNSSIWLKDAAHEPVVSLTLPTCKCGQGHIRRDFNWSKTSSSPRLPSSPELSSLASLCASVDGVQQPAAGGLASSSPTIRLSGAAGDAERQWRRSRKKKARSGSAANSAVGRVKADTECSPDARGHASEVGCSAPAGLVGRTRHQRVALTTMSIAAAGVASAFERSPAPTDSISTEIRPVDDISGSASSLTTKRALCFGAQEALTVGNGANGSRRVGSLRGRSSSISSGGAESGGCCSSPPDSPDQTLLSPPPSALARSAGLTSVFFNANNRQHIVSSDGGRPDALAPLYSSHQQHELQQLKQQPREETEVQLFSRRRDYSVFNSLPRHRINSVHIKMDDDDRHDDIRTFILSTLAQQRITRLPCCVCHTSMNIFDRYPLLDGTLFLSPVRHSPGSVGVLPAAVARTSKSAAGGSSAAAAFGAVAAAATVASAARAQPRRAGVADIAAASGDGSAIQYLNGVCMACLDDGAWSTTSLRCVSCSTPWSGGHLIIGTLYSYDIFAARPCCDHRLRCNRSACRALVMTADERLRYFFSDYSHHVMCPTCRSVDYHFVKPLHQIYRLTGSHE